MHKKTLERGFSVIEAVIVIAVIGVLGWIGYTVWASHNKDEDQNQSSQTDTETWQAGGAAVPGAYADADVVQVDDNTWRMYYGQQPEHSGGSLNIYSSTSTDGKTWTQDKGTRKSSAAFPEVIQLPDGRWRMYFQQAGSIKSAISSDGLTFTDEPGTRVDATSTESPAVENAAAPAIFRQKDGTYVLAYRATISGSGRYSANSPNPTTSLLLWATSEDGLTFTKKGIAIDPRNTTLDGQIDGATFITWDDGKTRVYATSYGGVFKFPFDGSTFGSADLAFAGDAQKSATGYNGAPPGDPTLAKINGTWFMYYGGGPEDPGIHYATLE